MYARVTEVQGSPDKVEDGIRSFNEQVLPAVQGVDGYKGAILLVDRSTGKGLGLTLWEDEDARRRGGEAVAQARENTIQAMGASVPAINEYEVAAADL